MQAHGARIAPRDGKGRPARSLLRSHHFDGYPHIAVLLAQFRGFPHYDTSHRWASSRRGEPKDPNMQKFTTTREDLLLVTGLILSASAAE
jgi:hypothetical protein